MMSIHTSASLLDTSLSLSLAECKKKMDENITANLYACKFQLNKENEAARQTHRLVSDRQWMLHCQVAKLTWY